jgi:arylsulfatase A-like enzyme
MPTSHRPNILLILTDQQSGEALSLGDPTSPLRTPHLDALAARGLRFDRAYCSNPLCVPSRTSMFTGTYSHRNGISSNQDKPTDENLCCAGTAFRDAGYDTAYFGKWHIPIPLEVPERSGFDTISNNQNNGTDLRLVDHAIPWLGQKRDKPFFCVASFNNPHNICEWARGTRGLELPDGSPPEPPSVEACPPLRANHQPPEDEPEAMILLRRSFHASPIFPVGDFDGAQWRQYQFAYHRMVELVDGHVGRLLSGLRHMGLENDTVVVFLSDHGDNQGAHRFNQKTMFYEESARVPCMIAWPGHIEPGISRRLVNTGPDLMPTLFACAGIETVDALDGESFLSDRPREQIVVENFALQGAEIDGVKPEIRGRMLRTDRYKYCCHAYGEHRESLVDLESDPGEMRNLARDSAHRDVLLEHRRRLREHCRATKDPFETEIPA